MLRDALPLGFCHNKSDYEMNHVILAVREFTTFKPLSFEDAVKLFQQWGFQIEPGPRPEEVALILEGPDYRAYSVRKSTRQPTPPAACRRSQGWSVP